MGYARTGGVEGQLVQVVAREFLSSEDGERFFIRMDGWPREIVAALPPSAGIWPSNVDHLVALIRQDLTATVYVNELTQIAHIRSAWAFEAGQELTDRDIADVVELHFEGLDVPPDAALLVIFSHGWRKGLFFDFFPFHKPDYRRPYDLWKLLGSCSAYLMNQAPFRLTDDDWSYLINSGWFPFSALPPETRKQLIGFARSRMDPSLILPSVKAFLATDLGRLVENWSTKPPFQPHLELLKHAVSEFVEGDFVSTTAIVVPRIEGLMREVHASTAAREKATPTALTERLIQGRSAELHEYSWLLPHRFTQFLREAYFANFEPGQPAKFSRHSVGHGVASPGDFNEKSACVALLTLDQIFWLLP